MMIKPQLNELIAKVPNRYTLVAVVSKRARQLVQNPEKMDEAEVKPVALAVDDLMHDRIEFKEGSPDGNAKA